MSRITSNGYKIQFVGKEHHLADVNGYAYEHRIVAEEKIGRRLIKGEIVHHLDENRLNNDPENLSVEPSRWHHNAKHRKLLTKKQHPHEKNEVISCGCGCGEILWKFDYQHNQRTFISGHNTRLRPKLYDHPKPPISLHNIIKKECPHGHLYTPDNLRLTSGNRRSCKACHREQESKRRKERKTQLGIQ